MKDIIAIILLLASLQNPPEITKQVSGYSNKMLPVYYQIVTDGEGVFSYKRGEWVSPIFCDTYEEAESNAWQDYWNDQTRYEKEWVPYFEN